MKKSVIAVAIALAVMATLMTACKKDGGFEENTVPDTTVEYSTDENGETYVTNVNGEKIPVTTDKNGYAELYSDLITKTAEQVSKEQESLEAEKTTAAPITEPVTSSETTKKSEQQTNKVVIGKDDANDGSHDAVIDWR